MMPWQVMQTDSRNGVRVRHRCVLASILFSGYREEFILRVKHIGLCMRVGNEKFGIFLYVVDVIIT